MAGPKAAAVEDLLDITGENLLSGFTQGFEKKEVIVGYYTRSCPSKCSYTQNQIGMSWRIPAAGGSGAARRSWLSFRLW